MRLVLGFEMSDVREETRALLVTALGALGCEAEFGLGLLQTPLTRPQPTHAEGEQWLRQCYLLGQRLVRTSTEAQVAIQSYLGALAAAELDRPSLASDVAVHLTLSDAWGARFDATPGVWWPEQGAVAIEREPIELWLRRAGFGYRHIVTIGLPTHLEALDHTLGLVMHALRTLPPGGVVTRDAIAISLMTLSTEIEGDLVPHHLRDLDARHVGLLTGIATLLRLTPRAGASLGADLAWARGELARARALLPDQPQQPGSATRPLTYQTGKLWARQLVADWERTLAQLEATRGG